MWAPATAPEVTWSNAETAPAVTFVAAAWPPEVTSPKTETAPDVIWLPIAFPAEVTVLMMLPTSERMFMVKCNWLN